MATTETQLDEFRRRIRHWLADNVPEPPADGNEPDLATAKRFQAKLYDADLAGIVWPKEYGGQGLTSTEQQAFDDESIAYELPTNVFIIGLGMCGPTLVDLGTAKQKQRYLRPLLRGDEIWCQLFSEPGAGSDVGSLQTRAVRSGDDWVLNGQKVWTSAAHHADFGAVLARTNPDVPKHKGLTMFIVDMRAPGMTVRPLRDMSGRAPFNEVCLDDVRVEGDAVLGELDAGWLAAVTMLGHERVSIGGVVRRRDDPLTYANLAELARHTGRSDDSAIRAELAGLYAAERALSLFNTRLRQESDAGKPPGARGSVAKLAGAALQRRGVRVASLVAGPRAIAWQEADDDALATAINTAPAAGIAGGTDQIQRTIIGERVLGLSREPQADRDVPYRELRVGTQRG